MTQQWKLVPVEPTDEMAEAFAAELGGACGSYFDWDRGGNEAYAAMLGAAPTPPASAQDDAKDELTLAQKYDDACHFANANARDAARYRWLREGDTDLLIPFHVDGCLPTGDLFDAAVDAVIAASQQQEG